jgi:hypothetical protein
MPYVHEGVNGLRHVPPRKMPKPLEIVTYVLVAIFLATLLLFAASNPMSMPTPASTPTAPSSSPSTT